MERWKDFGQTKYQVSDKGNIKSFHRLNTILLEQNENNSGYLYVDIYINTVKVRWLVSRLVLVTWKGYDKDPRKKFALHINNIKADCSLKNLKWGTQSENELAAYRDGLKSQKGERNSRAKVTDKQVKIIREKYNKNMFVKYKGYVTEKNFKILEKKFIYSFTSKQLAEFLNMSERNLQHIVHSDTFRHLL